MNIRRLLPIMLIPIMAGLTPAQAESPAPLRVSIGITDSAIHKLAVTELKSYLSKIFTNPVDISGKGSEFDIIVGTTESNTLVAKAVRSKKIALPTGKNSDQGYAIRTLGKTVWVIGNTDQGTLYGIYELLEQYGAYFQIDGERLPAKTSFEAKELDINKSPVFKYRGLLPWDNFLCGMSGYDLEQYQELIDRGTRMKFNMLQFHFYAGEAFFTETVDGKTVDPVCIGMPIDVFRTKGSVGEPIFKGREVFGPKPYVDNIGNPRKQAEAVQAMMRKVIDHAHTRGWDTVVGFELMVPTAGNPSMTDKPSDNDGGWNSISPVDPRNVDISLQRYRSLTKIYPNSDFYWMWQSEARGVLGRNVGREPGSPEMREKFKHWAGREILAGDVDYAYLFREVVNRLTPQERERLATGGWSVEHLFPGINPDFPKELIFASLNSYYLPDAAENQVPSYRVAKDGRRAWMIEWWEFDGNQWFPQFRIGWQKKMYDQCVDYGVESVTLLGWKLTGVEHNVRYLSEYSWNPSLDDKKFYQNYVQRLYGTKSEPLSGIYLDYDEYEASTPAATPADYRAMLLGAGWMPIAMPTMPGTPDGLKEAQWQETVRRAVELIPQQQKLLDKDKRSIAAFNKALPEMDKQGQSWAKLMMNRMEFRALYLKSMLSLNQSFIEYDKVGREQDLDQARPAAAIHATQAVELARQAIEKYAEDIRNRGDEGVIAQLNEQYYNVLNLHKISLKRTESTYAVVDWETFRLHPTSQYDFSGRSPWPHRDGNINASSKMVDGRPTLRLEIGANGAPHNSVFIHNGVIDLVESPYLDFRIKTSSTEPVAILFQSEFSEQWCALNLIGNHQAYTYADGLPADSINNGEWHRVTWDLHKLYKEKTGEENPRIRNLILGCWEKPDSPIVVEFRDFAFGKRNVLD